MEQLLSNKIVYHIIVIILAALAAFIPRYLPVLFFSTRKIPEWFNEWMKYVPVSLFATLVVKGIFLTGSYHFTLFGYPDCVLYSINVDFSNCWIGCCLASEFSVIRVVLL